MSKALKYGITWGLSQSMMFYGFAAAFGFGTYLVGTLAMEFEDVFRLEVTCTEIYVYSTHISILSW